MRDFYTVTQYEVDAIYAAAEHQDDATNEICKVANIELAPSESRTYVARLWMEAFETWRRFSTAYAHQLPKDTLTVWELINAEERINFNRAEEVLIMKRREAMDAYLVEQETQ